MVEYSVYIHLLGAILVFGVAALLDSVFRLETHLSELPARAKSLMNSSVTIS